LVSKAGAVLSGAPFKRALCKIQDCTEVKILSVDFTRREREVVKWGLFVALQANLITNFTHLFKGMTC
jgi:hypothetical protein